MRRDAGGSLRYAPVEKHFHERIAELQIPPLRYPGFPVKLGGVVALHAPFFTEGRMQWPRPVLRGRKSGYATVGMTLHLGRWEVGVLTKISHLQGLKP
jgi:hypothetical protein